MKPAFFFQNLFRNISRNSGRLLLTLLCVYLCFLLLRYPSCAVEYAYTGLTLWLHKMVPALLPFMILSGIMIRLGLTKHFSLLLHPICRRLFGTSPDGSYIILMGFLCGFPMGARIIGELYGSGRVCRKEAAYLLSFCNNIGPIYFLSYIIPSLGLEQPLLPLCLMYGVPLLYGIFLRRLQKLPDFSRICFRPEAALSAASLEQKAGRVLSAIDHSILSGLIGIAKLGGYMIFFNLLVLVLKPFDRLPDSLCALFRCFLEITSGIGVCPPSLALPVLILLPFGGLSCIAQTFSMIEKTDLSLSNYVLHKLLQLVLTFSFYTVFFLVFGFQCAG